MIKRVLLPLFLLFALMAVPEPAFGQEGGISKRKQEKTLAKKEKKDKKAKAKQDKFDRKRHLSLQDKDARKRLKRHTKRADRRGTRPHKDGFFRRTFGL